VVYIAPTKPTPVLSIFVAILMSGLFLMIPFDHIVSGNGGDGDVRIVVTYLCLSIGAWMCAGFQKGFRSGTISTGSYILFFLLAFASIAAIGLCFTLSGIWSGIGLIVVSVAAFGMAMPAGYYLNGFVKEPEANLSENPAKNP
jgi:hypothetical protein